ncbi:MAG: hypothetical protein ACKN9O_01830, partial [Actinomycetota bacterium]
MKKAVTISAASAPMYAITNQRIGIHQDMRNGDREALGRAEGVLCLQRKWCGTNGCECHGEWESPWQHQFVWQRASTVFPLNSLAYLCFGICPLNEPRRGEEGLSAIPDVPICSVRDLLSAPLQQLCEYVQQIAALCRSSSVDALFVMHAAAAGRQERIRRFKRSLRLSSRRGR